MRATSILLALLLLLALGVPAAAMAQSAGDDQYTDPFSPSENEGAQGGGGQGGGGDQGGSDTAPSTGDAGTLPAQGTDGTGDSGAATGQGGPTLPNTGVPAALLAAIGGGLLAAGLALRRRA